MNSKTIGVIGLGSIGMRHAKNLLELGHTVLVYDPAYSGHLIEGFPLVATFTDVFSGDGVVIASPTQHHLAHLDLALREMKKPVFVEKPIGDNLKYAKLLLSEDKAPVMVGNNLRFHPCVKQAKVWMQEIGTPIWASFTCSQLSTKPQYLRDGVLLNWGAHEIDLALYLLGPAKVAACVGDETFADVCLLHESGVRSTVHVDYNTPVERRGFFIAGFDGNIDSNVVGRNVKLTRTVGSAPINFYVADTTIDDDYVEEMQAFIDLIDGNPVPHAATGEDGLRTLEIILAAKKMAGIA